MAVTNRNAHTVSGDSGTSGMPSGYSYGSKVAEKNFSKTWELCLQPLSRKQLYKLQEQLWRAFAPFFLFFFFWCGPCLTSLLNLLQYCFWFLIFFGYMGSFLPKEGLNLTLCVRRWSLNHWTATEVLPSLFSLPITGASHHPGHHYGSFSSSFTSLQALLLPLSPFSILISKLLLELFSCKSDLVTSSLKTFQWL